jgi:hypothetical protein
VGNTHQGARYRISVQEEDFVENQTTQEQITFQESDEDHPHRFQRHPFVDTRKEQTTFSGQQLLTSMESYESKQKGQASFKPT